MNKEKLKMIVEKEDAREFSNFLLELKREEILKLSGKEYDEILKLCGKLKGNKKLLQEKFLSVYYYKGAGHLKKAMGGKNSIENALISKFCFNLFLSLLFSGNLAYAEMLTNKGSSLIILAEQGIETESNLKESVKCFEEAAQIFQIEKSDLNLAKSVMNKGNSLRILADMGIDTENNIKNALNCFDEASSIFKKELSDLNYALTIMNKGCIYTTLANKSIEPESNLNLSIENLDNAAKIFRMEKSDLNLAKSVMNKGNSIRILADMGIDTENNIKNALNCFDEASSIFKKELSDLNYAQTMNIKGISYKILAERDIEKEKNFEMAISCYIEAENTFYEKSYFLPFIYTSYNHILVLWWKYKETKNDNYLKDAIIISKKARKESVKVVHPVKERLLDFSIQIYDTLTELEASSKESYEEIQKKMDEMLSHLSILSDSTFRIETKTDIILKHVQKIENLCNRILADLEESGIKLQDEDKEELKKFADDVIKANQEQISKFTEELIDFFRDPKLQKEIENEAPKYKSTVNKIFLRIKHIINELGIALGAAITAEEIIPYIESIMHQITILSGISPGLAATLILIPLISIKTKTLKEECY